MASLFPSAQLLKLVNIKKFQNFLQYLLSSTLILPFTLKFKFGFEQMAFWHSEMW